MQNKRFMQNVTIITLGVLICVMSVVFAVYGTAFEVTGTTTISSSSWDIHFENIAQTENTNIVDSTKIDPPSNTQTTALTFGVKLDIGDVYEFTTDIKNAGTFNAKVASVSLNGTKDATDLEGVNNLSYSNEYLRYTVTYADGSPINENDFLNAGDSRKIKIRVEYVQPEDSKNLPTEEEEYTFKLNINYVQQS